MIEQLVAKAALIIALGIFAQWLAWRVQIPAIVLLAVFGLLAGPATGLIDPAADLGPFFHPTIAGAVAVILFEGGLNLRWHELREAGRAVGRLVIVGAPLGWGATALAAHYVAGLSWGVSALFGGILIVTGPTVIVPLLRHARLARRPGSILKWEGIINDPLGALFAVLAFEALAAGRAGHGATGAAASLVAGAFLAAAAGIVAGWGLAHSFRRGWIPEFLKVPAILAVVIAIFAISNAVAEETGLIAVTALGVTLGNARLAAIDEVRRFKESIATVLIASVFVILTASLSWQQLVSIPMRHWAFVAALLFLVRPAVVLISLIGADLPWKERWLVAWIAPRGIVAVAVSGLFADKLVGLGYPDGAALVPLSFAIVFATVVAHGFTIRPLGRLLSLAATARPGLLLVGGTPWTTALARTLKQLEIPTLIADGDWRRLRAAREAGIDTYYGEILSEVTEHHLDMEAYGYLLAATRNDAYNALVCSDFGPEIGRSNVFQVGPHDSGESPHRRSFTVGGRAILKSGADSDELERRLAEGWRFHKTRLTEDYDMDAYLADRGAGAEILLALRADGALDFATKNKAPKAQAGDTVVAFCPPGGEDEAENAATKEG